MVQGWRVLDATSFEGVVSARPGSLTLTPWGESSPAHVVPAADIAMLLIGVKTSVTAAALHRMTSHDIVLLASDWRGVPIAGLYPWSDHGRVAARHISQASLSQPRKKNAWMQLIRAKISGQAATLRAVDPRGADRLSELAKKVRSGDPDNLEGLAARIYWSRLLTDTDGKFRRDPESTDPFNWKLNYGYAVVRGYGIRAVLAAGLSPPLGLFHRGRGNFFNLVDDIIEPFRPAIDDVVRRLESAGPLDEAEAKRALVAAASQVFRSDGKRIPALLTDLSQQLGRYVEGEVERLVVPSWNGVCSPTVELGDDPFSELADEVILDPPW